MANKHFQKLSKLYFIKELQIKAAMWHLHTPFKMAKVHNIDNAGTHGDREQ
jgi:hypothetical protein